MKHISKMYGNGVLANDDMNLELAESEILAVVGENGAGKSTIMKILYGLEQPTDGEIYLRGEQQKFRNPQDAMKNGIGMVQQNFMLLPPFTVAENVVYGNEPRKSRLLFDRKKAQEEVGALSKRYGLAIDPALVVGDCPVGLQQRCEILKVLYQNADIIIFDEPSAVLTPQEVDGLLDTLRHLAKLGKGIIIITHKLSEVMAVSDRCIVMRGGKHIATVKTSKTNAKELSAMMVGREIVDADIPPAKKGDQVLEVEHLIMNGEAGKPILKDCSIHANTGEIVGIAGVSGNGQTELLHTIVGLMQADSGDIRLDGKKLNGLDVRTIRDAGCAYVPEDRNTMGCALKASLSETMLMAHQYEQEFNHSGILQHATAAERFNTMLKQYDVKYASLQQAAGELSGGNLQKLIVAREMSHNAKLLIISEPTRGVDIGAMEFIHNQVLAQRAAGKAIVLVSSDLSELLKLADRVYVMYDGCINGELTRVEATPENVGILMMGGTLDD